MILYFTGILPQPFLGIVTSSGYEIVTKLLALKFLLFAAAFAGVTKVETNNKNTEDTITNFREERRLIVMGKLSSFMARTARPFRL